MYVGRVQPGNRGQGCAVTSNTVSETRDREWQTEREREGGETGGSDYTLMAEGTGGG